MKDTSNLPASFGLSSWFLTQWRSPYNKSKQEEDCTGNYILPTNHGFPLRLLRYMRTGSIVRMEERLRIENEEKVWTIIVPYPTVCSDSPSSLQIPHLLQLSSMHLTAAATASGLPNPPSIGGVSVNGPCLKSVPLNSHKVCSFSPFLKRPSLCPDQMAGMGMVGRSYFYLQGLIKGTEGPSLSLPEKSAYFPCNVNEVGVSFLAAFLFFMDERCLGVSVLRTFRTQILCEDVSNEWSNNNLLGQNTFVFWGFCFLANSRKTS